MINRTVIAAALAGVAVLYLMKQGQGAGTAGDEDSNFLLDGIEDMSSILNDWPIGSGPYQAAIIDAANTYGVPERILAWLLWKECRYTSAIITGAKRSPRGAMGIAQFMPATAKQELGSAEAALDPAVAIPGAARYLAKLARSTSNWAEALAAYNWGIGNVQRKGIGAAPAETVDYYNTILAKAGGDYA